MPSIPAMPTPFIRTRLTWQAYLIISFYSYLLNALGPLTPFLRDELNLSYTVASFHFSAYALGIIVTGLLLKWAVQRFGARSLVWAGVFGMSFGTLLLILGRVPWITILGVFLMGLLGVLISALLSTALAEQHGENRAIALVESTLMASLLALLAPVAVGLFARTAFTWRGALGMMLLAAPVLWLVYRRDPAGKPHPPTPAGEPGVRARPTGRLPLVYWFYWLVILLVEAIEFCLIFWAADYLEKVSGLSKANAALGMSAFMGAMVVGRALVSRLLRRSQEQRLLFLSLLVAAAGFLLFWLSPGPAAALVGLMIAGLGVAGQFPISNSLALSTVPDRMVEGSANVSLAVGLAILLLPLALGRLADSVGIRAAFGLELGLLVLALLLALGAQNLARLGLARR